MKRLLAALAILCAPIVAHSADNPDWAYPVTPQVPAPDDTVKIQIPGSDKSYTRKQIGDGFNPPDWFPGEHPAMPPVVANGRPPAVRACALCYRPTGDGHPESASLTNLNEAYFVKAMQQFKQNLRKGIRANTMVAIAATMTDAEVREAWAYYSKLKPTVRTKVVETDMVAKSVVQEGGMRFLTADGGTEPIGQRIIELPGNDLQARYRNAHVGFTAYVPTGSIEKGKALASSMDKTVTCAICHGPGLKGLGEVPSLAGRSPMYTFRQLNDMKTGNRSGEAMALMRQVVANLTDDDMIALSAYVASLEP